MVRKSGSAFLFVFVLLCFPWTTLYASRGEAMNGGFGLVLDGGADAARRARAMLDWDVSNGVARRAWSGSEGAGRTIRRAMAAREDGGLVVTVPNHVEDETVLEEAL